jgi:hypothetical protein
MDASATAAVLDDQTLQFYLRALDVVEAARVPYCLAGAYCLAYYAGIVRHTKDLDLFVRERDIPALEEAFDAAGYRTERTHPHWLAKAFDDDSTGAFVDLIFRSGNGMCRVDDDWLSHAASGQVWGRPVPLCPAEEVIWSKSYIQERNRFDGADVAHLLLARGPRLDWERLLRRFAGTERVLLAHVILFGFIYPTEKGRVPQWAFDELVKRVQDEKTPEQAVCRGTVLSWEQYLPDLEKGFIDGRLAPWGRLTQKEIDRWTAAEK